MSIIQPQTIVQFQEEYHYIFVTTNQINTNTGVNGTPNNFSVSLQPLVLDQNKQWTIEIISFTYPNQNITTANVFPIILTDQSQNILVNNTNSSILYKSSVPAKDTNYVSSNLSNNVNLKRRLNSSIINFISIQIVRSDNGEAFTIDPAEPVEIQFLIKGN